MDEQNIFITTKLIVDLYELSNFIIFAELLLGPIPIPLRIWAERSDAQNSIPIHSEQCSDTQTLRRRNSPVWAEFYSYSIASAQSESAQTHPILYSESQILFLFTENMLRIWASEHFFALFYAELFVVSKWFQTANSRELTESRAVFCSQKIF